MNVHNHFNTCTYSIDYSHHFVYSLQCVSESCCKLIVNLRIEEKPSVSNIVQEFTAFYLCTINCMFYTLKYDLGCWLFFFIHKLDPIDLEMFIDRALACMRSLSFPLCRLLLCWNRRYPFLKIVYLAPQKFETWVNSDIPPQRKK